MGLFQKMSCEQAYAVLKSGGSSNGDLKKAEKVIKELNNNDPRKMPYTFLSLTRQQDFETAYFLFSYEISAGELSELMLAVLNQPIVCYEFIIGYSQKKSLWAGFYLARAYESGWGIERDHEKAVEIVSQWGNVTGEYAHIAERVRNEILSAKAVPPAPTAAPEPMKNEDIATVLSDNKTENTTEGVLDALLNGDGLKEAFEKYGMMTFDSAIIRDLAYGLRDLREATGAKSAEELSEKQFVKYQDKLKRAFWAMDAAFWNAEASGSKGEKETVAKVLKSNYVFKLYYKLGFYADCAESCLYCALMKTLGIAEENYDVNFNDAKNLIEAAEKFGASPECITRYKEFVSYKSDAEKTSSASSNADSFEKATPPAPAAAPEPVKNEDVATGLSDNKTEHITEIKRTVFDNGDVYEGEYFNGKKHGHGKYTSQNGWVYEGDFADDTMTGYAKAVFANGANYEGHFLNGKRSGKGKEKFANGNMYEGEYKDDKLHGKGKYTFQSGAEYVGEFVGAKREGHGKYTYTDGTYYDGEWKDGKRNGHGVFTDISKTVESETIYRYEGEWIDDKRHGGHYKWVVDMPQYKSVDFFDHGEFLASISVTEQKKNWTMEQFEADMRRFKDESKRDQERIFNKKIDSDEYEHPLPTATPHAAAPVSGHSDSEDEWESFDDIDDLLQKLKTPSLFADPRDRCIVNSCEYIAPFLKEAQEEFEGGDNGAVNEIIGSIFHITSMDLCDASFEWDKVVSHTSFESFLRSALYGLSGFDPEDPYDFLIPLANVVYYIWKYNPDNSWFEILCHVWVKLGGKVDENLLWFKRMRDCGDCNGTADDPIDESNFGEILDRHNYNMGSDCCLYEENPTAPGNSLYRYEPPEVDDEYKLEMVLEAVFNVGEYVEPGTMSADVFYNWIEGCKSFTFTEKNGRINSGRVTRGGNFSKRLSALRPLQDYISTAKHAIKCLRESVPADDCNDYEKSLEDYIYLANDALEGGLIDVAYDWYLQAYNHGYDTRRLGEICGNAVISTLQKEEHWSFYDSLVDIYKIAVFCYPEKYSDYFETLIADHDYPLGYITELLLNREYA